NVVVDTRAQDITVRCCSALNKCATGSKPFAQRPRGLRSAQFWNSIEYFQDVVGNRFVDNFLIHVADFALEPTLVHPAAARAVFYRPPRVAFHNWAPPSRLFCAFRP